MDNEKSCPQTPFDSLIIPRELQILKLLLPVFPSSVQKILGIYIKFMELQYTIRYFHSSMHVLQFPDSSSDTVSFRGLIENISPYLDKKQAEALQNIETAMQMAELFQASGDFAPEDLFSDDLFSDNEFLKDLFSQSKQQAYDNKKQSQENENAYGSMDESSGNGETGSCQTGTSDEGL